MDGFTRGDEFTPPQAAEYRYTTCGKPGGIISNSTDDLFLVSPHKQYRRAYDEMMRIWNKTGENPVPWVLRLNYEDFPALVAYMHAMARGEALEEGQLPSSTFWLMHKSGKMLGAANIRHTISRSTINYGGHIGYGIRPDERCNGYATAMLLLALAEAKKLGIDRVRVTCNIENDASRRVIEKNGGVFDNEYHDEGGETILCFWIDNR